jgi:ComF family protein
MKFDMRQLEAWTPIDGWRRLNGLRRAGLGLLFPAACAGCGEEIEGTGAANETDAAFCEDCLREAMLLAGPVCRRCGAAVPGQTDRDKCYRCDGVKFWFEATIALGEYDGRMRDWLLAMKDRRRETLALAVGELLWQRCEERLRACGADVVVPVPMHWRRRLVRGTNSPTILAERLADRLRLPLATDLLQRTRHTPPQFSLPPSERVANVRNAFAVRAGYHLNAARVLLVDDIFTTGSTCSYAARALMQGGAECVTVAVAARTLRH